MLACALLAGCGTAPIAYQAAPLDPTARWAQPDEEGTTQRGEWSEDDLVALAIDRSPAVKAAQAQLKAARLGAAAARSRAPIGLTLSTEYADEAGADSPWLFGFGLDIPLDRGAARQARLTAADLPIVSARYELTAAAWQTRAAVHAAFVELQLARQALPEARAVVARRQQVLDMARARVAAGEDPASVLRLAQAEASVAQAAANQAVDAIAIAARRLSDAAFISVVDAQVAAVSLPSPPPSYNALAMTPALLSRPEVLAAIAAYDQAEADLQAEVAKQYPTISLGPGYTWERGLTKLPFNLSLTLPPPERNRPAILAAEAARVAAGLKMEAAQAAVTAEVAAAYGDYAAATSRASGLASAVLSARAEATAAEQLAAAGETGRLEALTAQAVVAQAEFEASEARRAAIRAELAIEQVSQTAFDPKQRDTVTAKIQTLGAE